MSKLFQHNRNQWNSFKRLTGRPDEFWAAVYDKEKNETNIGFYETVSFTFKPILKLPDILLDSMDIWIEEKAKRVYFIYYGGFGTDGFLVSVPLPTNGIEANKK